MAKDNLRMMLAAANKPKATDPGVEMGAMMAAAVKLMSDTVSGALMGQVSEEVRTQVAAAMESARTEIQGALLDFFEVWTAKDLEKRISAAMSDVSKQIADAIAAIPPPEMPEMPDSMEMEMEIEPQPIGSIKRKDGLIASFKVGDVTYDVSRNSEGLITGARPRG